MKDLVAFQASPFPFSSGQVPGDDGTPGTPFFQTDVDGRRFHMAPRGGKLFEDVTYSDRRSLLFAPAPFDPRKPGAFLLLFLHGNLATLERDVVARQRVPAQLVASHRNAVLVAPQLAVNALDSSPGHFYEPNFLETYLREAAQHIDVRSGHRLNAADIDRLPVVIVAYSGGYLATAFSLHYAMPPRATRIAGVVLLDALFGEEAKIEDWLVRPETRGTFFVSAYSKSSASLNLDLETKLRSQSVEVQTALPPTIKAGDVIFRAAPQAVHNDFVTQAWTHDPLADVLRRIRLGTGTAEIDR